MALSLRGASYSDASMALSGTGPVASVLVNPVGLAVAVKQIPGHLADQVGHKMGLASNVDGRMRSLLGLKEMHLRRQKEQSGVSTSRRVWILVFFLFLFL